MPNISMTLTDISQAVTRPVIFDIIKQVQEITKITQDAAIYYPGDSQKMQTPGTNIDTNGDRSSIFNTGRYNFIETEEDYDRETLGSTAITRKEHIPIFIDKDLKIIITPIYATTNITINFKYRCPSKVEALRWRDDIRTRISQLRDINLHSITYHYTIPMELLDILTTIYDLRENYLGYEDTFVEYMTNRSTDRLTLIGDLIGKDARLAVSETQTRIIGIFNFDGLPEKPERDDNTGTWTISFSYKFSYEKPISCNMRYPIMVHNQLLPDKYINFVNSEYDLDKIHKSFTKSLNALNNFESDNIINNRIDPDTILRLPRYDDYNLLTTPNGTGTIFIALSEVDTSDSKTLFNLNELGDMVLDKDILQFIKEIEYPYITDIYKSFFNFTLYRNEYISSSKTIVCDSNLNIKARDILNLRNQHRVRFSLITDISLLDKAALERLKRYPKVLVKIISAINELLRNQPDFNRLADKSSLTSFEVTKIYELLTGNTTGIPIGSHNFLKNIDPKLLELYRRKQINLKTVMLDKILTFPKNN